MKIVCSRALRRGRYTRLTRLRHAALAFHARNFQLGLVDLSAFFPKPTQSFIHVPQPLAGQGDRPINGPDSRARPRASDVANQPPRKPVVLRSIF